MPHRLQAEHSRLQLDPADTIAALESVLEQARTYLHELDDAPVRKVGSDEAARRARGPLPEEGDGTQETLRALFEIADGARVATSGPRFFHWVIGGTTPAALAADWLASVVDQNAGGWHASPLSTELETVSISWLLDLFGLPSSWSGVLLTGGTMANFTGLAAGRGWCASRLGVDVEKQGVAALPQIPVLSSGFIHVSALKSLGMLGLGRATPTICAADATGRIDLAKMEEELERLDGAPAILIGNAGEVNAGHFDPIADLADLAERYGAWLHVDGAFGLFAGASPRTSHLLDGIEGAHSVSSDGHKWLNVPYDCGFTFVRDASTLEETFYAGADYLPVSEDERPNYGYRSPELSRRARSLAVWATLKAYGRAGYREIVERCLDNAAHVARLVEEAPDLELLAPAPFNIVCFRYRPEGVPEDELDALNLAIEERVLMDGRVYVGSTRLAGTVGFRPAFVNWRTTREDASLVVEVVRDLGEEIGSTS
jgi:glutamate/tyrosine decarboxylase-like PLP-dependent enzyme